MVAIIFVTYKNHEDKDLMKCIKSVAALKSKQKHIELLA